MGEVPTTENQLATTVNKIIDTIIFGLALKMGKAALVVDFPFLGWPIFSTIADYFLNRFGKYTYVALAKTATLAVIDLQTESEQNSYAFAERALRGAHQLGDPNALAAATAHFEEMLGNLIHFDGSASP